MNLRQVAIFARHHGQSPERLGPEDIRTYRLHLIDDRQLALTSVAGTVAALHFLYQVTINRLSDIGLPERLLHMKRRLGEEQHPACAIRSQSSASALQTGLGDSGWRTRTAHGTESPRCKGEDSALGTKVGAIP